MDTDLSSVRRPDAQPAADGPSRDVVLRPLQAAAYEERRAAANGAIAVKIVEKVVVQDAHGLNECANRVMDSPVACRRVLDHLAVLARRDSSPIPSGTQRPAR